MKDITLNFVGPFTFTDGIACLFHSEFIVSPGVYLWTIKQDRDSAHLIHYVGETYSFGKRHREHLTQILGLNYGIFDPDKARKGVPELLWKGLWRDKSGGGPSLQIEAYQRFHKEILSYLRVLNVFFAELKVENQMRKHIEGCIGLYLRNKHPEHKALYPDDNHVKTIKERVNGNLKIATAEEIKGLDEIIPY